MKRAFLLALIATTLTTPLQARESLGVFGSWGAFRDSALPRCYAIAEPHARPSNRRWRGFAAVGYWPRKAVRGQVHFRLSRERNAKAPITLGIGVRRFNLIAGSTDAWAPDKRMDAAIIAAIRSGVSMRVQGISKNGAPFVDAYGLRGAATAIDAAAFGCAKF